MKNLSAVSINRLIHIHGKDILDSPGMISSKDHIQHGHTSVYDHSCSVAAMCLKVAFFLGISLDVATLIRGALLHDYFLYDWHEHDKSHRLHGFTHSETALKNADKDFELNEIEKNMIRSHMFPMNISKIPTHKESMILCLADKIVSAREVIDRKTDK